MAKEYVEVEIVADEKLTEQLIGVMSQLGFEGFWEDGRMLRCYMSRERWTHAILPELQSIAQTMARSSSSAMPKLSLRKVDNQDWNEKWEKTIRPIHVGRRIVITPSWHRYRPSAGEIVLIIDPKMSFGTGYHETTRLVLRLMEHHLVQGITLLDVGTGTGVLAIAAVKLGARSAVGVDNDEWSYSNARENVSANGVDDKVTIIQGEISSVRMERFDMIVANLQKNVIEEQLEELTCRLSPTGLLILSGLLLSDRESIMHDLDASHLKRIEEISENEWIAIASSHCPAA